MSSLNTHDGHDGDPIDLGLQWMLLLQDGDPTAFSRIVDHYGDGILNLAFKYTGSRGHAEDLAQEVFLRIYRARHRYRPDAPFRTWVRRIVLNLCINWTKQRRLRAVSLEALRGDARNDWQLEDRTRAHPDRSMEEIELGIKVREAIQALSPSQRAALILSRYEGLSHREISEVLGSTEKAVKSLLARARVKIKDWLGPYMREGNP